MKRVKLAKSSKKLGNPCWKGYEALGMKVKGGRTVPNCVPKSAIAKRKKGKSVC